MFYAEMYDRLRGWIICHTSYTWNNGHHFHAYSYAMHVTQWEIQRPPFDFGFMITSSG